MKQLAIEDRNNFVNTIKVGNFHQVSTVKPNEVRQYRRDRRKDKKPREKSGLLDYILHKRTLSETTNNSPKNVMFMPINEDKYEDIYQDYALEMKQGTQSLASSPKNKPIPIKSYSPPKNKRFNSRIHTRTRKNNQASKFANSKPHLKSSPLETIRKKMKGQLALPPRHRNNFISNMIGSGEEEKGRHTFSSQKVFNFI